MSQPRALVALTLGVVLFGAAMASREVLNPWWSNTAAALAVLGAAAAALGPRLRVLLTPRARDLVTGLALGAAMVGLTHLAYEGASALEPSLQPRVAALYADIAGAIALPLAVLVTLLIVGAEELLWRGVALDLCLQRLPRPAAIGVAAAVSAVPQIIGGSWILVAAAIVVGIVFALQRLLTRSLVGPLVAHATWSVAVFILLPLVEAPPPT